ncbi:hypothetical protein FC99_GL001589 [Levilactobacillus koreensis JCM 16448]|uniref:Uncharacterized protein n=1 Tax=Levilactobacillus koreensis TaxID=637971 RepID=A0AAC8UTR8_9LACO|nr:hypothetical protein ABN16_02525 [Levilactobacillus koreensis]KRK86426.1 hypothetical protein FC99_GL001589 [Levilactobacillus koreensis JCM 16448]
MQPAVEVVLAGDSEASLQHGRLWRHAFFVASKRARRLVIFQSEASPQQAEFLSAGVRQFHTILMVQILANTGARQVFYLSTFSYRKRMTSDAPFRPVA